MRIPVTLLRIPTCLSVALLAALLLGLLLPLPVGADDFKIAPQTRQLIVGISDGWNSSHTTLLRFERRSGADEWVPVGEPWPARLGRNGMAWGRGLHPLPRGARMKKEGDGRAPGGVFTLGMAYGYQSPDEVARHRDLGYHQVGERDMWVEDVNSPYYNQHLRLRTPGPTNEWEEQQQMRLNDHAHSLKLFVNHNAPPDVVSGAGSAIFFHIWRENGARPTAGCTTLAEPHLREMIAWVDPGAQPLFVLLPWTEYQARQQAWNLPAIQPRN